MTLAHRILDAFPAGNYGLAGLLRILDVVETTGVETASVECREWPVMRINPEFVATFAETPEKLMMLVMHELHHVLLGHTRLFPRVTEADNLVFDAVINALLCRMFPAPPYTAMFRDFYSESRFPDCFLRPPADWAPDRPARAPAALAGPGNEALRALYRALYSEAGATYKELYDLLTEQLTVAAGTTRLLGSHGEEMRELTGPLLEAVRAIVENWPQPPQPIRGRSLADILRESRLDARRLPTNRERLAALLRRISRAGGAAPSRFRGAGAVASQLPIPAPDRRALVLRSLGSPVLLYGHELPRFGPEPRSPVHVYLDVSGSTQPVQDALFGAVLDCRELIHPRIHLFSTQVADVPLAQLRRGILLSTGGTSIECVARHMKAERVRRAALLTDGYVGRPGATARATLGSSLVAVALIGNPSTRDDLAGVVRHWAELKGEL